MKSKKVKLLAGTLAAALVIGSFSTNYAGAEVRDITGAVAAKKKKTVSKKKTRVVVKTASELNNALKNSANKEIRLKTDKKITLNLKGNHKGVKLIISAPKAEITNKGRFKIIEINGKKWVEKAKGNGLVVKSAKTGIEVSKNAKAAYIRFLKSGAKAHVSVNGEVKSLIVDKKAELKLTGKTELVSIVVNAGGTKITSGVQIEITATKNTEAVLKKGAEGSSVKASDNKVKVVVKNETKEEVFVENAAGDETVLESGAYKELKNGIVADKGKSGNSLDNTVSLNDDTTPLGDVNTGISTGSTLINAGNVMGLASDEDKYAPIEDKLLLKVINKNIDKDRADDQRVTKEEMASLKVISIFLGEDGKPKVSQGEFLGGEDDDRPSESILGKPRSLKDTPDFKFMVSRGIKSIKGLEYAVNLEQIKLNENEIADISPLRNLKKLKYIELQRNRIVDVSPLAGLTELRYLKLYNNLIEDVTPLAGLTKLKGLDLHYNVTVTKEEGKEVKSKGITEVSEAIKDMKELEFLDLSANRITNVKGLENLTHIKDLDLSGNNITDYRGLGEYLAERYIKVANEEPGWSLNFSGQTTDFNEKVFVSDGKAEFDNPFLGIDELDASLSKIAEDDVQFFMGVEAKKYGDDIKAVYDKATNKIKLEVSNKLVDAVKLLGTEEITVPLVISDIAGMGFSMQNVKLNFTKGKTVQFEDNNLKEYLLALLKGYKGDEERDDMKGEYVIKLTDTSFRKNPKDTEIYESEMAKIEALTFVGWDKDYENEITVKSIKGLEKAVNLKMLTFSSSDIPEGGDIRYSASSISDLTPIKDLKKLEFLRLSHNNIEDVTPLKELTNLKHLYISHNRIADVSPLGKLTNLADFDISINYIADVSVAKNYNKLTMFNAIRNKITDISALKDITGLLILNVKQNDVKDIDCIKDLVKLETLNLEDNKNLGSIKVIKNLTKLKELNLNNCGIDDADVAGDIFEGLTKLTELNLNNNSLRSIDFIKNSNELENLYLDNNKLTSLEALKDMNKLKSLRFSGNDVVSIAPLAGHTGLTELRFPKNNVEDIAVVSTFSELGSFELNGNKVYDFTPLSGLTSLYEAVIDGQNVDYKGEAVKVSDLTAEMDSPVKGLASIGAANIKVASSDSNIQAALEEGKIKFTLNETAGAELKAKGEKMIDLTFSFRNEKDFSYLSFPDGEPNNSITVKGVVLK
jgi:hypothetical protein